jgi:flagellar motor protein MotB
MLLLVFCLLLAAGSIIAKERKEAATAIEAKQAADERASATEVERERLLAELASVLEKSTGRKIPDEEWRELVLAKHAAEGIRRSLPLDEAVKLAPAAAVLKDNKVTEEMLRELVPAIRELTEQGLTAEQLANLAPAMSVLRDRGYAEPDAVRKLEAALKKADEPAAGARPHEWPPIISLSELEGYNFEVGSAELSDGFRAKLQELSATIAGVATSYGVDVIEVIGHTDEQGMAGDFSNLDRDLRPVLEGKKAIKTLHPADNAGLGLARAISVAGVLEKMPELEGFTILPMSGGQLILPGDRLTDGAQSGDVKARRRIEIRVRQRSTTQKEPDTGHNAWPEQATATTP